MEREKLISLAVLIDELKHEDPVVRLNSLSNIEFIAESLGEARTRTELVPFLTSFVDYDEDDILLTLAEKLGKFVPFIGGHEFTEILLPPLELLSGADETAVHEAAVKSIVAIVEGMDEEPVQRLIFPMIERLADNKFAGSRRSTAVLVALLYSRFTAETRRIALKHYEDLCGDEHIIVRRAAASTMGKLIVQLSEDEILQKMVPNFNHLAQDIQDSVRLLMMPNCIAMTTVLSVENSREVILPVAESLCQDRCWRVRYVAADLFVQLCEVFGTEITQSNLCEHFVRFLGDVEAEVRTAAASIVTEASGLFTLNFVADQIIPAVSTLSMDESQHTRAALAGSVMGMCSILEPDDVLSMLNPLFLNLLRDSSSEVRLNVISKLDSVGEVIGLEQLSKSIMPAIIDLALDRTWRIRLAIIEHIPLLAKKLMKLSEICMTWLSDEVAEIRRAATHNLTALATSFGPEWAREHVVPRIQQLMNGTNYLHRMTPLNAAAELCEAVEDASLTRELLVMVLSMAADDVPNVRFKVCSTLESMSCHLPPNDVGELVLPCLQGLSTDADTDVVYFANRALDVARKRVETESKS